MYCKFKQILLHCFIFTLIVSTNASPRIKYGEITKEKFPFLAFLFIGKIERTFEEISLEGVDCAGSLIKDQWVLTAGHCVASIRDDPNLLENEIIAYFGSNIRPNLLDQSKSKGYFAKAVQFILHDRFVQTASKVVNDIALIKLEEPVPSEYGSVIPIPQHQITDEVIGQTAVIIGWGQTESSKDSKRLRQTKIKLGDYKLCRQRNFICQVTIFNIFTDPEPSNIPGTGHGDSGGPLLLGHKNDWILIGVVSGEIGLENNVGDEIKLGAYTDVSKYLSWISGYTNSYTNENLIY